MERSVGTGPRHCDGGEARRRLDGLFTEMGLAGYVYSVEPGSNGWSLIVECPVDGGWQRSEFVVEHARLARCEESTVTRRALLAELERHLCSCRRLG